MTGRVCPKHEEWCPTGECRWCAPEEPVFAVLHDRLLDVPKLPPGAWTSGWQMLPPPPVVMHFPACKQNPCTCHILSSPAAPRHQPGCPLRGILGNEMADLAAGCICAH